MKKLSLLLLCPFFIISCKNNSNQTVKEESEVVIKKPIVYVSTYPLQYFAQRIGGEHLDLRFPMKDTGSITNWKPQTDTITSMQKADMVFINGASFEKWLMSTSIPESILINTTKNLESSLLETDDVYTHSHGGDGAHKHRETASITWLDLSMANNQAEVMANQLSLKFPEHKIVFQANFEKLSEDLLTLNTKFKKLNTLHPDLQVIYSHPVYQYFENAYDVAGRSVHWEPSVKLNHDRAHHIEHLKDEQNFNVMIWEAEPLKETQIELEVMGIKSVVVNPMYTLAEDSDYLNEMESSYSQLYNAIIQLKE